MILALPFMLVACSTDNGEGVDGNGNGGNGGNDGNGGNGSEVEENVEVTDRVELSALISDFLNLFEGDETVIKVTEGEYVEILNNVEQIEFESRVIVSQSKSDQSLVYRNNVATTTDDFFFKEEELYESSDNEGNQSNDFYKTHLLGGKYYAHEEDFVAETKTTESGNVIYSETTDYTEKLAMIGKTSLAFPYQFSKTVMFENILGKDLADLLKIYQDKDNSERYIYVFELDLASYNNAPDATPPAGAEAPSDIDRVDITIQFVLENKLLTEFDVDMNLSGKIEESMVEMTFTSSLAIFGSNPTETEDYSNYSTGPDELAEDLLPWT